jgi:hypothetical protein
MNRTRTREHLGLLLLLAIAGCSAAAANGSAGRDINLLTAEEIAQVNRNTAYEVIELLRPQWLQGRSAQSVLNNDGGIVVYMDDVRYGDINSLRTINVAGVVRMERYTATAASQRWGPGHSEGVIVVSTRR